jgi:hypothetical protein
MSRSSSTAHLKLPHGRSCTCLRAVPWPCRQRTCARTSPSGRLQGTQRMYISHSCHLNCCHGSLFGCSARLPGPGMSACVIREQLPWPAAVQASAELCTALPRCSIAGDWCGIQRRQAVSQCIRSAWHCTEARDVSLVAAPHLMLTCALSRPAACSACARLTSRAAFFSMRYAWAGAGVHVGREGFSSRAVACSQQVQVRAVTVTEPASVAGRCVWHAQGWASRCTGLG